MRLGRTTSPLALCSDTRRRGKHFWTTWTGRAFAVRSADAVSITRLPPSQKGSADRGHPGQRWGSRPQDRAEPPRMPWTQTVTTHASLSTSKEAYVIDDIPLPVSNPWKRNMRLADIAFLNDNGDAAAVSFDGDVWLVSGLTGDLREVNWKRFASGLHEPMSIVARPTRNREPGTGKSLSSTATASGSSWTQTATARRTGMRCSAISSRRRRRRGSFRTR